MRIEARTSRQQRLKARLREKKISIRGAELPLLDKAEVLTWLQRLFACIQCIQQGRSEFLEREANALGISEGQLIALYCDKVLHISNPLMEVLTEELKECLGEIDNDD